MILGQNGAKEHTKERTSENAREHDQADHDEIHDCHSLRGQAVSKPRMAAPLDLSPTKGIAMPGSPSRMRIEKARSCARRCGRTKKSAPIELSPNIAASGRRNAETGKSNQSAPNAHATPINKTNQPTLKRSKRNSKREICMARGFARGADDCLILSILFDFAKKLSCSRITARTGASPYRSLTNIQR